MAQHFLLSAAARTLSAKRIMAMNEDQARDQFARLRWEATGGKPVCPRCGCLEAYAITTRNKWKCKGCHHQFSVTSGTLFHSRKMAFRDILLAILIFINDVKGRSALSMSRTLDCQYKTSFVLCHKLREAMASEIKGATVAGTVEIDGAYFGGYRKPANRAADRVDRRLAENQTGQRRCVVTVRERDGKTLTFVGLGEDDAVDFIKTRVDRDATIHADESPAWHILHARYAMKRVNHEESYSSENGACTNQAESFFSRLRRAEMGQHHHISGIYLPRYAAEMAWREDHRRRANGWQTERVLSHAMACKPSVDFCGYWNRRAA